MEEFGFHMLLYKNRIVITGGTGRFASSLKRIKTKYLIFYPSKSHLNILNEKSILSCITFLLICLLLSIRFFFGISGKKVFNLVLLSYFFINLAYFGIKLL